MAYGKQPRARGERRDRTARPTADVAADRTAGTAASGAADAKTAAGEARLSLYDEVTSRIVAELEAGSVPWVRPWSVAGGKGTAVAPGLPCNAISKRAYSGVNILILWAALFERGYATQRWLTFKQARDAGGSVRKGERGVTIVYADRFTPEREAERAARDQDEARAIPFLKRFTVFNVAQCDGLDGDIASSVALPPKPHPVLLADVQRLIDASGVDFRVGGPQAFYAPDADFIQVPEPEAFFEGINFYRTALHELTHWTGHRTRLARDFSGPFGSPAYAREELVAEMGSAFLCASLGIVPTVRHTDYLAAWLAVLRADNRAIFRAASAASKAATYLLGFGTQSQAAALERAA